MLPSPSPKFYVAGALLSSAGALALWSGLRRGRTPFPRTLLALGALLLVIGVSILGAGLWIDADYYSELNTTTLWYRVSVQTNSTGLFRLLLPAPSDGRLFDALNVTNGSSSLRLSHTAADTSVELSTHGNVSFEVRATVASPMVNSSFTRVTPVGAGAWGLVSNATVELVVPHPGVIVHLQLDASIGLVCETHMLIIDSQIEPGVANYLAQTPTSVC